MLLSSAEFMPQTLFVYSPRDLDAAKPFWGIRAASNGNSAGTDSHPISRPWKIENDLVIAGLGEQTLILWHPEDKICMSVILPHNTMKICSMSVHLLKKELRNTGTHWRRETGQEVSELIKHTTSLETTRAAEIRGALGSLAPCSKPFLLLVAYLTVR